MKSSERFKETIQTFLEKKASTDELFAKTYKKEDKNIDNCITYILNTVKKSGANGFEDEEIYSMAIHYYDEDIPKEDIGKAVDMQCVVNHQVILPYI